MGTRYSHMALADRLHMQALLSAGKSGRFIAKTLGFSTATISRELGKVRARMDSESGYFAFIGQNLHDAGRKRNGQARRKLDANFDNAAAQHVLQGLRQGWSPEQIRGRAKQQCLEQPNLPPPPSVSHETVYAAIYAQPRGLLRTELVKLLRKSHSGRLPRARGTNRYTAVQDMTLLALRPPDANTRLVPGHWEGDLLKGAIGRGAIGTLVERTSRYTHLVPLSSMHSNTVVKAFSRSLRPIPVAMRKSLTYDQGTEMARHKDLTKKLTIDVYFCDPHSPWQRPTNENTNGLLREYFPKGTDFTNVTKRQLKTVETQLNNRPRKVLGYRTPAEVFVALCQAEFKNVALQA